MRPLYALALLVLTLLPAGCGNLNFYTEVEEAQLGVQAYAEATKDYPVVTGTPAAAMLQRVGQRIATATGKGYQWEFRLLKADDVANAFCLPGGKVAVYTGILPLTVNEDGLAVVLGHEIAHATLRHGGKRMTQGMIADGVLSAISSGVSLTSLQPEDQKLVMGALGAGAQLGVMLPYSRAHETEADEVGLRYAIRAGYDPWEAPKLWERMAKLGGGGPEWLRTHPDSGRRAENLKEKIPQLLAEERGPGSAPAVPPAAGGRAGT